VTNNHVVENAEEITVRLNDDRELTATLVGTDPETDLAVLRVEGNNFPYVRFETEARPRVGDWVLAIGNPLGLGGTVTAGVVSAYGRQNVDPRTAYVDYMQIDAPINRGNSGGPTFDIYGRVIGVNTAIYSPTGNSVGIGFAIPVSVAKPIVNRLMRGEQIERGYIGVVVADFGRDEALAAGLTAEDRGALVMNVNADGPAARSGLRVGDIVMAVDGRRVRSNTELTREVARVTPGQTVRLEVVRDGRRQTLSIRADARPSESALDAQAAPGQDGPGEATKPSAPSGEVVGGLNVANLTAGLRQRYGLPADVEGVVVTGVARGGDRQFSTALGSVILMAGQMRVSTVGDLKAQVAAARRAGRTTLFLIVRTPQRNEPVVLELPAGD